MVRAKLTVGTLSSSEIERLIPFRNQEKIGKKEQEEREEFERLRVENDEEFQLWMRKLDAIDARRHRQKLQQRGEWKCSWGKTRSATESDNEDEEKNCEGGEDEESSDDSMKRDEREKEAEKKKRKMQEFEDVMYKYCYLAEKKNNPRKFARTMSKPLNMDSDGEEIPGLDLDGEPMFSDEMVVCSEAEDEEEETEYDDLQGPYTSSDDDDGTGAYYEEDELNYNNDNDGDCW
ncbi:nucleolar protein 58-like [Papaver somniferum]|uniref:nucleolar protein 58-like n=1 Tax=Papaver somniferum TaxID=3469 RepID=UPI000E6F8AFA|nr:nucleolar protein 58-like [Papaver somniferum]